MQQRKYCKKGGQRRQKRAMAIYLARDLSGLPGKNSKRKCSILNFQDP
jgi:hypothetical protein